MNECRKLMYKNKLQIEFIHKRGDFVAYRLHLDGYVQDIPFHDAIIKKNVENVIRGLM